MREVTFAEIADDEMDVAVSIKGSGGVLRTIEHSRESVRSMVQRVHSVASQALSSKHLAIRSIKDRTQNPNEMRYEIDLDDLHTPKSRRTKPIKMVVLAKRPRVR